MDMSIFSTYIDCAYDLNVYDNKSLKKPSKSTDIIFFKRNICYNYC